ncbi:MAG: winged helix-turn-helix domain-containing protein [Myxococcota bacterium]
MSHRILVVTTSQSPRQDLPEALWREGWEVTSTDPAGLRAVLETSEIDAVVVASDAPPDALERAEVPVVQASGSPAEAVAMLQALFPLPNPLRLGPVTLDLAQREILRDGERTRLTRIEVQLLRFLVVNEHRVVMDAELGRKVWGHHDRVRSRAVVNAVYRLRKKLEAEPSRPRILTSQGGGYRLVRGQTEAGEPLASAGNLPARRDAFQGRAAELERLRRFTHEGRLVSLVGPGGAGKSRLAIEFARAQSEPFDGCWLVDLTEALSADEVVNEVAVALGVHLGASEAVGTVAQALAGRGRTMLILDNCERIVPLVAEMASRWLDACPDLVILATSRERLAIRGEQLIAVHPLPLPESEEASVVQANDAARLFALRAAQQDPEFDITEANAAQVARIIGMVDGLPLAIELVATLVSSFALDDIGRGLDASIDLLTGQGRDRPARHVGLRAALDWSWEQLSPQERTALSRLTVFAGGFRLQAAEAVVGEGLDLLGVIQRLADKSMVQRRASGRFGLLVSIRRYAGEKLPSETLAQLSERHAKHFVGEEPTPEELHNLQAACRYALDGGDGALATELVDRVWLLVQRHMRPQLAVDLAREGLRIATAPADLARLHAIAALAEDRQGRIEATRVHLVEAAAMAERSGDPRTIARCAHSLAIYHWRMRDYALAIEHNERAKWGAEALGDHRSVAATLNNQALAYLLMGRYDEARAHFDAARQTIGETDDAEIPAQIDMYLGLLALLRGEYEASRRRLDAALTQARALRNAWLESEVIGLVGRLALDQGDLDEARTQLEAAQRFNRELGNRRAEAGLNAAVGDLELRAGRPETALARLNDALAMAREVGDVTVEGDALARLALAHEQLGRRAVADMMILTGRRTLERDGIDHSLARLVAIEALIRHIRGDVDGAHERLAEVDAIAERSALPRPSIVAREIDGIRSRIRREARGTSLRG